MATTGTDASPEPEIDVAHPSGNAESAAVDGVARTRGEHPGRGRVGPPVEASPSVARMLASMAAGMATLVTLTAIVGYFFRDPLLDVGRYFVSSFGGFGVALGFFIPDAFTVPLPNDAFTALGLLGGMDFWLVAVCGSLGSVSGGCLGWLIGARWIGKSRWLARVLQKRGGDGVVDRMRKGGPWFLAATALTPLPYSIGCWSAGAIGMPFSTFFAVSLLRIVRVTAFLWMMEAGFATVLPQ